MNIIIIILIAGLSLTPNPLKKIQDLQKMHIAANYKYQWTNLRQLWNWNFTGPEGGEIIGVICNPAATNLAIAFSATDVWRTTDGGTTWRLSLENCMAQTGVMSTPTRGIIVDINGTVWITLNGGSGWTEVLYTNNFQTISSEIIDTVIYLIDSMPPRILRSTNSGLTWQIIQTFNNLYRIDKIAHVKNNPSVFWFIGHTNPDDTLHHIYYSPAGNFVGTIRADEIMDFQPSPYNPNQTMIATDRGIYHATSATGPWSLLTTAAISGLFYPVDIDFTGNDSIVVSSYLNPGIFTGRRQFGIWSFSRVETREIATYMSIAGPTTLYCGSLGKGVFKSTNKGASWEVKRSNLYAHTLISPGNASDIFDSTFYFIGLGGTPYKTRNWGNVWDSLPKNFLILGSAIEVAPTNPHLLIVSAVDIFISGTTISTGTIFRSTDGGQNWQKVDSTYSPSDLLITKNPDIIIGLCDTFLIRSTNGGYNFMPLLAKRTSLSNPVGIDTIFVATNESTFVSFDRGASWNGLLARGGSLAYDQTRKLLFIAGNYLYRYSIITGVLDSLFYSPLSISIAPNGNLFFLHFIPPDSIFIARSFDGGNTIEQEPFLIPVFWLGLGGLKAGNRGLFYYQPARGFWVNNEIFYRISEMKRTTLMDLKFSCPAIIKKGEKGFIDFSKNSNSELIFAIYDITGRKLKQIHQAKAPAGTHRIYFSTNDLSSGVYFILGVEGGDYWSRKIIIY